jgi:hypothetical protein
VAPRRERPDPEDQISGFARYEGLVKTHGRPLLFCDILFAIVVR